ncbi:polysaccharide deacetylase family protein [Flavobacterium sp.]|uniref:polysaccharide deacetylase family protein n=1 Tax=Flavobacterium sp. TaxID=239 RepID=UPI0040489B15
MNFFWTKTPYLIKKLFSNYVWNIPNTKNEIFLTFDDGPIPEVTEWVLDILAKEAIKATFFCIGDNIRKNPHILKRIINEGHSIGNHTFNHLNGWKNNNEKYFNNIELFNSEYEKISKKPTRLFRPPYGKIKPSQSYYLRKKGYKIIMWDIISYDFDKKLKSEKCLKNIISNCNTGSVIVFHDSLKAEKNLKFVLPKTIQILKEKGYTFNSIKN